MDDITPKNKPTWFSQKLTLYPTIGLIVSYSVIAAYSPLTLAWVDHVVTPLIDSLRFIGSVLQSLLWMAQCHNVITLI